MTFNWGIWGSLVCKKSVNDNNNNNDDSIPKDQTCQSQHDESLKQSFEEKSAVEAKCQNMYEPLNTVRDVSIFGGLHRRLRYSEESPVFTKTYHMIDDDGVNWRRPYGLTFEWYYPSKGLTHKILKGNSKKGSKDAKPIIRTGTCKRFFNTFHPPQIGKDDDDNNEDVVDLETTFGFPSLSFCNSVLWPSANVVASWVESALTMPASVSFLGLGLGLGLVLRTGSTQLVVFLLYSSVNIPSFLLKLLDVTDHEIFLMIFSAFPSIKRISEV
ncbi:hypothetical protein H5410_011323, partial [Solanum commersonii]